MVNEQQLEAAEDAFVAAFETAWAGWALKADIAGCVITEAHLRTICALWFGKGCARGCAWGLGSGREDDCVEEELCC